jgi:ParB family chromosome partitioning protein
MSATTLLDTRRRRGETGCGAHLGNAEVATFRPEQTFVRRKAFTALAEAAARVGDFVKLEEAIAAKLEEEAAFAAHVQGQFPHGYGPGRGRKRDASQDASFTLANYCEQFGFKARTVQKWYRPIDDAAREAEAAKCIERARCIVLGETAAHVSQNSGENEWYTPPEYIEAAREVMGGIDLDPASTAAANEVVKAEKFLTIADDGLKQEWHGRVWLNPPYAQSFIGQFAAKLAAEFGAGRVTQAVALVNNATETEWFGAMAACASAVCFPQGRIRYWYPGRESLTPLQGQAVLYVGFGAAAFVAAFEPFGDTWLRGDTR